LEGRCRVSTAKAGLRPNLPARRGRLKVCTAGTACFRFIAQRIDHDVADEMNGASRRCLRALDSRAARLFFQ